MKIYLLLLVLFYTQLTFAQLNFSAQMDNRYDKVYKYIPQGRLFLTDHFKTDFDFDIKSNPVKELKLHARLSVTKYWNQWYTQNQLSSGEFNFNTDEKYVNDHIRLSLAYLDYKPFEWFSFIGGRLPTIDGTPVNFYNGSVSEAILPKLAYGAEVDGALAFGHIKNYSIYLGYIPFLLQNYGYQTTNINAKPLVNGSQIEAETLAPRAAVGIKAYFENLKLNAYIHHSWINYLRFKDTSIDASFFDSSLSGSSQLSSSLYTSHQNLLFHIDIKDVALTNLDLSASYMLTTLQSNGQVNVTSGTASGRNLGGYGTSLNSNTFNGSIFLLAALYTTTLHKLNNPQVGVEYLNATRDAFYYDKNPDDPSQFYATRGQGYHLYLNQPLNNFLSLRVGYRLQYFILSPWALGESAANSTKIDTYYGNVKAIF
ncbi:MAG: hypothetical protein IPM57_00095 [Oligoflexia bacterium]|nr:hypothetical protein [Oligoflexia bacterium]